MSFDDVLREYGDTAAAVSELLYGNAYEEVIKSAADEAERKRKSELMQTRISQASNVVGLGAGVLATPPAIKEFRTARAERKAAKAAGTPDPKLRLRPVDFKPKNLKATAQKLKAVKRPGTKLALAGAGLGAGVQVANLGGDALTSAVLSRTAKRTEKQKVQKSESEGFDIYCEISKMDTDKRQVFGWASISKKDGQTVLDLQGDSIDTDELERAAYKYILDSRKGGHEHQKNDDNTPVHVADIIESFVVTPEKKATMGLPDDMPEGWWVGMKVHDDKVWELAKSGELAGFSVHGSGRRIPNV